MKILLLVEGLIYVGNHIKLFKIVQASKGLGLIHILKVPDFYVAIHVIPKWLPINSSFVCMLISPLCLIFTSKFFSFLYMMTRQRGLINMQAKE